VAAQQNKVANEVALKAFVESRTVYEIHEANLARSRLRTKHGKVGLLPFNDPRYPTRSLTSYFAFIKSRLRSPEFEGQLGQTRIVALAEQWKNMSAEERKVCKDTFREPLRHDHPLLILCLFVVAI
jgi:hypothetical protein